ncbi:hypothetical protein ACFV2V_21925 [Streptomyces sp. NPDC059698]|uniref:baeRF3 domain-containing protein n=1 Tax=unclassified Streptomyces TaxID=2593676 RepID=UPI000B31FDB9|nr:hypothetical protein [Streptomyces sp. CB02366]WSS56211.1 hypothetical protein OG543_12950 [Streptomyces sp. NBC_01178]
MPTDPDYRFNDKDRILLRDLVTEAKRRLADDPDVEREARLQLRDRLLDPDAIERAADPSPEGDAMVVYVAANEPVQVWRVTSPQEVRPRVEFAEEFLTRYLVDAEQRSRPYLVLVLDQETSRLYRGSVRRLTEVTEHGFPAAPQIPSPEDAIPGPIPNAAPYRGHEERVEQYLKTVDGHLGGYLDAHGPLPLFVIGGTKVLPAFEGLTAHGRQVAGTLALAGMGSESPQDLAERLRPALDDFHARQTAEAVSELDEARGQDRVADGPEQVWTAVADRRVRRLVLEESLVLAGRIVGEGRELETVQVPEPVTLPNPDPDVRPSPPGVATDIVERLVDGAVAAESDVLFVPDGTLPDSGGVAALLRY